MTPGYRCADAAEAAGDPLVASAPPTRQWLLIEHGGPWGRHALSDSGLDPTVVTTLAAWTRDNGARVLLIRRPGARPRATATTATGPTTATGDGPAADIGAPRWCHVDADGRARWGTWSRDLDVLAPLRDPGAGTASGEPVYLVCAHGRHDQCCAVRGRPLAAALARAHPDRTWECSHVGGDRFAGNLVVLPHGLYYGHVTAAAGLAIADAHDRGRVDVAKLRGRASVAAPAQAAQHHARAVTGDDRVDAFAVRAVARVDDATWRVRLDGMPPLVVRARMVDADHRLTCHAGRPGWYRVFDVADDGAGPAT